MYICFEQESGAAVYRTHLHRALENLLPGLTVTDVTERQKDTSHEVVFQVEGETRMGISGYLPVITRAKNKVGFNNIEVGSVCREVALQDLFHDVPMNLVETNWT
jgi:hypothetical protein